MHARPITCRSLGRAGYTETSRFRAGECLRFWGKQFSYFNGSVLALHLFCGPGQFSRYVNSLQSVRSEDRIPMGVRFSDVHPSDDNEWICSITKTVTDRREQIQLSATVSNTNREHGPSPSEGRRCEQFTGQEIPSLLYNLKMQYLAHMRPHLVPIVSQMNPIHTAQPSSF